jgi:hypothetical protein
MRSTNQIHENADTNAIVGIINYFEAEIVNQFTLRGPRVCQSQGFLTSLANQVP